MFNEGDKVRVKGHTMFGGTIVKVTKTRCLIRPHTTHPWHTWWVPNNEIILIESANQKLIDAYNRAMRIL